MSWAAQLVDLFADYVEAKVNDLKPRSDVSDALQLRRMEGKLERAFAVLFTEGELEVAVREAGREPEE